MPTTDTAQVRNPHPLSPDGTFQGGRLPAALAPAYVRVDEYEVSDRLAYVRQLAAYVNYVDETNGIRGNWSAFYDKQPAVTVARLLTWPLERLARRLAEHRELIEDTDLSNDPVVLGRLLESLFDVLTSAVLSFDALAGALPVTSPLHPRAVALMEHQLAPAFRRWLAYYRAGRDNGLFDGTREADYAYLLDAEAVGGAIVSTNGLLDGSLTLSTYWSAGEDWGAYAGAVVEDFTVYGATAPFADPARAIVHAAGHVFFHGIYEAFVNAALHLRTPATTEWKRLLTDFPEHAPHLALLLAFLQVRERQREMLNGLTDRHLNFYYRRVLRLERAPSRPPEAFLSLEPRKNAAPTYLPAGTEFRGGKDETTKLERIFESSEALTVTAAKIAEMRALFKVADTPTIFDFPDENRAVFANNDGGRYYAATVVNSADGIGGDLPEGTESWHPFGYRAPVSGTLQAGMEPARIGLAIASHYLYLLEGDRTIELTFFGTGINATVGTEWRVLLTTEEGWWETTITVDANRVATISLSPSDPAIVVYAEEVHQLGLTTDKPVCRLELVHDEGTPYAYGSLRNARLSEIQLNLTVNGVRQLSLSGSGGDIDPSKPFFPFGAQPRGGEVLVIGNQEAFQKAASIVFQWVWKNPNPPQLADILIEQLTDGTFVNVGESATNTIPDYYPYPNSSNVPFSVAANATRKPAPGENPPYSVDQANGYARFVLEGNWGHADYPGNLAAFIADPDNNAEPSLPYQPEFSEISLDYTAQLNLGQEAFTKAAEHQVFHLSPFGHDFAEPDANSTIGLLPPVLPQTEPALDAGALYLGIDDWEPGTQLQLLFAVEEGSADPLLEKPEDHLSWYYLDGNDWTLFPNDKRNDGTDGLLRSGIVRLDLPFETQLGNTRFGDERAWVRVTAGKHTDAVNYLRGIHAQAIHVVQRLDDGATASNDPLPAGTIAKLLRPLSTIKKIDQPYPTFGGAAPEARDAYFTRQSERLRHKDRGITEWDVEHLVLAAFPEVERVICLQHLHFEPGAEAGDYIYHELAAGHFTVLPLGRSGGGRANALRPYVSLTTREDITKLLAERMSCHATAHIRNPLFEEVRVRADVRFRAGTDEAWALTQIDQDIITHISPWRDAGLGQLDLAAEVHRSSVLNFLEELDYVDYVKNLTLLHLRDASQNGGERLRPTKLVALLVAAPSHLITPLPADESVELSEVCELARRPRRGRDRIRLIENPIA